MLRSLLVYLLVVVLLDIKCIVQICLMILFQCQEELDYGEEEKFKHKNKPFTLFLLCNLNHLNSKINHFTPFYVTHKYQK